MGRVGSCFDNAAAEAFFSALEWQVLSRHEFTSIEQARVIVFDWCYGFYKHRRRHSSAAMMSPISYENTAATDSRITKPSTIRGGTTPQLPCDLSDRPTRLDHQPDGLFTIFLSELPILRHQRPLL